MASASELMVAAELEDLRENAAVLDGWSVQLLSPTTFILGLPASDGSRFWLKCECDRYPALPPIWRWCDEDGGNRDHPQRTPLERDTSFFHTSGVICAPWSRLAYKEIDGRGPHSDWAIGDWKANSNTGQCKTLAAMAARVAVELLVRFTNRQEVLEHEVA